MKLLVFFSAVAIAILATGCGGDAGSATADAADGATDTAADVLTTEDVQESPDTEQGWTPAAVSDLYGAWENVDDEGQLRRYEFRFLDKQFADMLSATPAYRLLRGPVDGPLELLERGQFTLQFGPVLDTVPVWALDPAQVGQHRTSAFVPTSEPDAFALEVLPGVQRVFYRIETYTRFP